MWARNAAPKSAPNHQKAMIRYPALLARGGFHPQAIHGLWMKSAASMPCPARTHAPAPTPRAAMLGAARRGERQRRRSKTAKSATLLVLQSLSLPSSNALLRYVKCFGCKRIRVTKDDCLKSKILQSFFNESSIPGGLFRSLHYLLNRRNNSKFLDHRPSAACAYRAFVSISKNALISVHSLQTLFFGCCTSPIFLSEKLSGPYSRFTGKVIAPFG